MEGFEREGKAVGIILDVTLRHDSEGLRLLDTVKAALIEVVSDGFENDLDVLYLYHPEIVDPVRTHGEQFYVIGSYETDGWQFNLNLALKQTLYALALEDFDSKKYLILISDRLSNCQPIEKIAFINEKDGIDARILVVGIGDFYDQSAANEICHISDHVKHLHVNHPSQLSACLLKEITHGDEDLCCSTAE